MSSKLLLFVPTRRAQTETFVHANLARLPFDIVAYYGDECPVLSPYRAVHGFLIVISKALTKLRMLRLATLFPSLWALFLVRRHQPDVLMVEFGFHAVRLMEVAAWSGLPLVVHFRGSDASSNVYLGLLKNRYHRLFKLTSAVIVKNSEMKNTLESFGADPDSFLISPSGADENLFYGSCPADAPARFVSIGRFVSKKGPLETLEAFALMLRAFPQDNPDLPELIMVGDGPLYPLVQRRIDQLGLRRFVHLTGVMNRHEVASLLHDARAFVQHSRVAPDGDREGCPVAVMEAQLSGLPVVATRHAGIPDVVVEGVTGFLVDEGDVKQMASAMLRLAVFPDLAGELGATARKRALSRFTIGHHIEQLSELISRLAERL